MTTSHEVPISPKSNGSGVPSPKRRPSIADLRFLDLLTFLVVRRAKSVSGAARELKVTPSQVSKTLARLEARLAVKLITRRAIGITLTEEGEALAPTFEEAVESLQRLSRPIDTRVPPITLAAPSYMLAQWLQRIVDCRPCLRLRVLELPPATLRAYASQNIFDVAIFPSAPDRLTTPWVGICVGEMASGLFTTPATARRLGPAPVEEASLREIPFIMPVAKHQGLFAAIGDDCPLTAASRSLGHEAQSITSALILAAHTGHLVFGPRLAATEYLQSGELVEVPVRGWNVCEPILVACNGDRVLAPVQLAIVRTLRAALRATSAA